jgi:hypothetical protein
MRYLGIFFRVAFLGSLRASDMQNQFVHNVPIH